MKIPTLLLPISTKNSSNNVYIYPGAPPSTVATIVPLLELQQTDPSEQIFNTKGSGSSISNVSERISQLFASETTTE